MAFWVPLLMAAGKAAAGTAAATATQQLLSPSKTSPAGGNLPEQDQSLTQGLLNEAQQGQQVQPMQTPQAPQLPQPQYLTVEELVRRTR